MAAPTPRMHGLTHVPGGSDPIPGLAIPGGTYPDAILEHPCLEHYWPADEASGNLADRAGGGWDLARTTHTYSSITWPRYAQPGPLPGIPTETAVENDGLQGVANAHHGGFSCPIGTPAWWAAAKPFTIECWIYPTNYPSTGAAMLLQAGPGGTGDYTALYVQANRLNFGVGSATTLVDTVDLPLNTWHHVAARFDGTTQALFRNGVQVAAGPGDVTAPIAAGLVWLNDLVTTVDPFRGRAAQLALYSCALTDAEIAAHYAMRDAADPPTAADYTLPARLGPVCALAPSNDANLATDNGWWVAVTNTPGGWCFGQTVNEDGTVMRQTCWPDLATDGSRFDRRRTSAGWQPWEKTWPLTAGAKHFVGAAGEPAFANGFTNVGSVWEQASFRRLVSGLVTVEGFVTRAAGDPAVNSDIFVLPAGFRPRLRVAFLCWSGRSTSSRVDVNEAGNVQWAGYGVPSAPVGSVGDYLSVSFSFFADP